MKINFFSKIYLAITDFRLYPYTVQKEKVINALAYFVCFILLASAVITISFSIKASNWTNEFLSTYYEYIPEFDINSGELKVEREIDFSMQGIQIQSDSTKYINDVKLEELENEEYRVSIIAYKDAFAIGNEALGYVTGKYVDFFDNIDETTVYEKLYYINNSVPQKLVIIFSSFAGIFASYLYSKFMQLIFIAVMLMFLGSMFPIKYKYKHYLQVACYVLTLPVIIEVISLVVAGGIGDYTTITYYLLMYVYMYYSVRALTIDNIIITTQEKILGLKIKENKDIKNSEKSEEKKEKTQVNEEYDEEHDDDEYFKNTNYVEMSWDGEILSTHNKEDKDDESENDKK